MTAKSPTGKSTPKITDQPWAKNPRFVEVRVRESKLTLDEEWANEIKQQEEEAQAAQEAAHREGA